MLGTLSKTFGRTGMWHGLTNQFSRQVSRGAGYGAGRAIGQAGRAWAKGPGGISTAAGAGIGGIYGAVSDDTSILGGMIGGAAMGGLGAAGVGRYSGVGKMGYNMMGAAGGGTLARLEAGARAVGGLARSDVMGAGIAATRGVRAAGIATNRGFKGTSLSPHVGGAVLAMNRAACSVGSTLKGWR